MPPSTAALALRRYINWLVAAVLAVAVLAVAVVALALALHSSQQSADTTACVKRIGNARAEATHRLDMADHAKDQAEIQHLTHQISDTAYATAVEHYDQIKQALAAARTDQSYASC